MQKILITGSNGQLGNEMRVISAQYADYQYFFTDVAELDITDKAAIEKIVAENKIDFIVNCAAYTAVDKAESDLDFCYKLNRDAVKNLGEAAAKYGARIIHVSTDYVFDGTNHLPYTEEDTVCPLGVYGKSKFAGEEVLRAACDDVIIIRTAWLYSSFGNNFVKTMLRLGKERDTLNVVFDQIGSPTYAADLAQAIMSIIISNNWQSGVYHFSNEGVCSWYDFTKAIHRLAKIQCHVSPIESRDYPAPTRRPNFSVLNKAKIKTIYKIEIPHWEESLGKCLEILEGKLCL
ncbi:MAG: dTDP-4-dehydrorhamnose reductase [Paludibacter sp.]|jgi:dTDP-4-dehydrorhamnose reductase|nr:dTDP-4-dehydrorhamnose reductase [Paludibacter sp.]